MKWVELKDSEQLLDGGLEYSSLRVRLAKTDADRDLVYRLRYKVFNEELGEGIPENAAIQKDIDQFDPFCDYLMVEKEGKLIGSYRLLPGHRAHESKGFYSETQYSMRKLPINFNEAVEMGRACIRPEFRKQYTLICLLCGIRHYVNLKDAQYLFGLASLPKMSHEDALATFEEIKKAGFHTPVAGVEPLETYKIPQGTHIGTNSQVPPLLGIYFKIGATICADPSYDPVFQCHDVLTIVKFEEISERTWTFFEKFAKRGERE